MNECFLNINPCDAIDSFSLLFAVPDMPLINGSPACDVILDHIISEGCVDRTIFVCIDIECQIGKKNLIFSGCANISITSEPLFNLIKCGAYNIRNIIFYPCNVVNSCSLCSCNDKQKTVYTLTCCNDSTRNIDVVLSDNSSLNVGDVIEIDKAFGCFIVTNIYSSTSSFPSITVSNKYSSCEVCGVNGKVYESYKKVKEFRFYYPRLSLPCNVDEINKRICDIVKMKSIEKMVGDYKIWSYNLMSIFRKKVISIIRYYIYDYELKYKDDCCIKSKESVSNK